MSLEKALQFLSKMKEDKEFRAKVRGILDAATQRDYLMNEGLEFDQQDLISAIAEGMSEPDKMLERNKNNTLEAGKERLMLKIDPAPDYPTEDGLYLRGNDYSPVAVAVVLTYDQDKIPKDIEALVMTGVEAGAALSGTIQKENIGIEKMVCNIIGNPNIRYLILTGPESPGRSTGEAILSLLKYGIDERKKIRNTDAPTPYLFNLPVEFIEHFRKQIVSIIDLLNRGTTDLVRKAVWSCYQETPSSFDDQLLYDIGAYPEGPVSAQLTWRFTHPESEPKDETERRQKESFTKRMEDIKRKVSEKRKS